MTGFAQGVARYNEDNGADVKVIGWDPATQKGSFTNDFENKNLGKSTAEEMITQGADVILPVAARPGSAGCRPPRTTTSRRSGSTPTAVSRLRNTATCC